VSLVTFLNDEAREADTDVYGGGALRFYELLRGKGDNQVGLPVVGERGLLDAFDSGLRGSVNGVTHSERFTVGPGWRRATRPFGRQERLAECAAYGYPVATPSCNRVGH
jgi:hypothetical protein